MKVKFIPQNVEFDIKPGESVMHVAQDHNMYIKSVCKGVPSCAECRVRVVDGDHNVLPPGTEELLLIGSGHFIDRRRLSCQLKCFGDITIDLSEQIAKESGLIGGQKKKKLAIKDDRIEDATKIRSSEAETGSEETETGTRPARGGGDRSARSGGGRERESKNARPPRNANPAAPMPAAPMPAAPTPTVSPSAAPSAAPSATSSVGLSPKGEESPRPTSRPGGSPTSPRAAGETSTSPKPRSTSPSLNRQNVSAPDRAPDRAPNNAPDNADVDGEIESGAEGTAGGEGKSGRRRRRRGGRGGRGDGGSAGGGGGAGPTGSGGGGGPTPRGPSASS